MAGAVLAATRRPSLSIVTNSASWRTRLAAFFLRHASGQLFATARPLPINSDVSRHVACHNPNKTQSPPLKQLKGTTKTRGS
jgi:hypothetical protein